MLPVSKDATVEHRPKLLGGAKPVYKNHSEAIVAAGLNNSVLFDANVHMNWIHFYFIFIFGGFM